MSMVLSERFVYKLLMHSPAMDVASAFVKFWTYKVIQMNLPTINLPFWEASYSLLSFRRNLDVHPITIFLYPSVCVSRPAIHEPEAIRCAQVWEQTHDLINRFRVGPKVVPEHAEGGPLWAEMIMCHQRTYSLSLRWLWGWRFWVCRIVNIQSSKNISWLTWMKCGNLPASRMKNTGVSGCYVMQ